MATYTDAQKVTELAKFLGEQIKTHTELAQSYEDSGYGMEKAPRMQQRAEVHYAKAEAYREVLQEIGLIEEGF